MRTLLEVIRHPILASSAKPLPAVEKEGMGLRLIRPRATNQEVIVSGPSVDLRVYWERGTGMTRYE